MIITSFALFLLVFIIIGVFSTIKSKNSTSDYLLAGQSIKPWLVALSAVATTNSGYMFIGMIGYTYLYGLSSFWLMFGWIIGDFTASLFIHKKIRLITTKQKVLSFAGVISNWHGQNHQKVRILAGLITVIFLGTYAAAQLKAGSKALHVIFGWDYSIGAIIGAIMVMLYCFAGGIRASIWTDAAQSFVMFIAMVVLLFMSVANAGGIGDLLVKLDAVSDSYLKFFPKGVGGSFFGGGLLFVIGWLFSGFCVVGQPHIMVRFMTMQKPENIKKVRYYYYSFYTSFFALTIATGMVSRLIFPNVNSFEAELVLPKIAMQFLPEMLVGLVLAGLFAASMSTADSQILSCSASLTNDFKKFTRKNYIITKLATVFVTIIALLIALFGSNSVYSLVLIAWSCLGASFAPILTLLALNKKISENTTLAMMVGGFSTVLIWRYFGFNLQVNEALPAILVGFLVYFADIFFNNKNG